jgi:hypothetical protein
MSIGSAFCPQGNTLLVTTNGTTLTPSAQLASFNPQISAQPAAQATGLSNPPPQARIVNTGTAIVYVSFTSALRTAAVPGATTPSLEFPVLAGEDAVFTLPSGANVSSATPYALQINTISVGVSQALLVTFGEGWR